MNPNTEKDPLDQRIDTLLASRPLTPSEDFTTRVLAATEHDQAKSSRARRILSFALPLAAAIAIALTTMQVQNSMKVPDRRPERGPVLGAADADEIFLLEEGLSGLAGLSNKEFSSGELLNTLDALYLEI
ncbi:MAG: hypothetical protein ACPGGN_07690 [Opitutales bacterium]